MPKKKRLTAKELIASRDPDVVAYDNTSVPDKGSKRGVVGISASKKLAGSEIVDLDGEQVSVSAVKAFINETEQVLQQESNLLSFGEEIFKEIQSPDPEIEQAKHSFKFFFENVIIDDVTGKPIKLQEFQEPWIKALESDKQFIMILCARGHGKSSGTKSFVSWLLGKNRNLRIGIISATEDQAISISYSVEQILKDHKYVSIFGPMVPPKRTEKWTDTHKFVLRSRQMKDPSLLACGTQSSLVVGKRLDIIVLDDSIDENNSSSEVTRSAVSKWITKNLMGTLEPNGKLIVLGTKYHALDTYTELYQKWSKSPDAKKELIKGGEMITTKDAIIIIQGTDEDNPLWPERYSSDTLRKLHMSMGSISFNMQYKNEVYNLSSTILRKDWLHLIAPEDLPPRNKMNIWLGMDPNISTKEDADYFTISVVGQHVESDQLYLIDIERFRGDVQEHIRRVKDLIDRYNPSHAFIETNYGQILQSQFIQSAVNIPIIGRFTTKNKQAKMATIAPLFESGKVLVVATPEQGDEGGIVASSGIQAFYKEWLEFPGGEHDDTLDAVEKALSDLTISALSTEIQIVEPQTPEEKRLTRNREQTIVESDLEYIVSEPDTDDIQKIWRQRRGVLWG